MKRALIVAALALIHATGFVYGADRWSSKDFAPLDMPQAIDQTREPGAAKSFRLVYPVQAAEDSKIDAAAQLNRVAPPTVEEAEVDPVTPLGQVQSVLTNLEAVKKSQEQIAAILDGLTLETLEQRLKDAAKEREELAEQVGALREALDSDSSQLSATLEKLQSLPVVGSKLQKLSSYGVLVVLLYVVIKLGASFVKWASSVFGAVNTAIMAKAVAKAKEELKSSETK